MRIIPSQDIPSIVHMVRPLRAATRPSMWLGMVLAAAMFCAGCATVPPQGPQGRAAQVTELLREANDSQGDPAQTIGRYLNVVETALALATDRTASSEDRTKGMHVYNAAVADFVTVLQKQNILPDGAAPGTFPGAGATYALQVISDGKSSVKNPAAFTRLIESGKISRGHMEADVRRAGLGATFVGVIDSSESVPHRSPKGFAEPLTAIAAFQKPVDGITPVKLFLFDPRTKEKVTLNDSTFVLNADFTAPLAYFPKRHELIFGIAAMLRVDRVASRSGIYFVEPFDPHKIPVLFVHGLMSSPHAWIQFINKLNSDPEFRRRYQPWVYFYPSGAPIALNALHLRKDLAEIAADYPLKNNLVIVGHSMGGILTKMQVVTTGRALWNGIFGRSADAVSAMLPDNSLLKKALIFDANPHVSRVIFISTPHLGSRLAGLRISRFFGSLIRMPAALLGSLNPKKRSILKMIDPSLRSVPSSIIGLSPKSRLLKSLNKLPITVPYHSIIGNRGRDEEPLAESSDGVVPYWSSHLDGAQSEIIVPTGHDAFNNPKAVAEVLRILALGE